MDLTILRPSPALLGGAMVLDVLLGDPVYSWHPIRLMGRSLSWLEEKLRAAGGNGRIGGCLLFVLLTLLWAGGGCLLAIAIDRVHPVAAQILHLLVVYTMIALRDLFKHTSAVDAAASAGNLALAREAISKLVGRDNQSMDAAACRRAAIESLSENVVDGFISAIFWYALLGLPGILLFKAVSTMDSMVGYKTPRYLYFGWCGARLDDFMNVIPARLTWILIGIAAAVVPGCSSAKAWRIGWRQHGIVPGPNSGWSEAAIAGALQRRLIGPIWLQGRLVTEIWLGSTEDAEAGSADDYRRASRLVLITAVLSLALTFAVMLMLERF